MANPPFAFIYPPRQLLNSTGWDNVCWVHQILVRVRIAIQGVPENKFLEHMPVFSDKSNRDVHKRMLTPVSSAIDGFCLLNVRGLRRKADYLSQCRKVNACGGGAVGLQARESGIYSLKLVDAILLHRLVVSTSRAADGGELEGPRKQHSVLRAARCRNAACVCARAGLRHPYGPYPRAASSHGRVRAAPVRLRRPRRWSMPTAADGAASRGGHRKVRLSSVKNEGFSACNLGPWFGQNVGYGLLICVVFVFEPLKGHFLYGFC
ncbi:hypothetical protein GGX14DRAFT_392748 [Mycena pura]|uniref:Uncharacterized protein n=1 Tax=Mycena pura TaxID=153505 RepID=A0AAD6VIH8_9AGAR|nr:hypothetical protein GGX14DRAFT_392748 [Mycena pura]